jgi:hypothetical protein
MMRDNEIDRILSQENQIAPSSGFVHSVMGSVRREAAAPPPIPFPWPRALPGIVAYGAALVWLIVQILRTPARDATSSQFSSLLIELSAFCLRILQVSAVDWLLVAILLTLFSVGFSLRLAGER